MLTLILGRGKTGKTTRLLREVLDCPAMGMAQRILLVPEQLSHETERAVSAMGGDGISYVSEVLSFTRMASRVSSIYGGGARQVLDKGGRMLTARLALSSIHSQLKVFAASAGRADFLGSMVSMIDELKSYGVSPGQLQEASARAEGLFAQKLRELGLILGAYDAVMARGTCDPRDRLTLLRQQLLETDYARDRYFFVDGFTDFSTQELQIIEALLRRSGHLTITLPCDLEDGTGLFAPGRETLAQLRSMAARLGEQVTVIRTEHRRDLPPELTYLEKHLFSYDAPAYPGLCRAISVDAAPTALEACRRCAGELRRQAMAGMRWRDMAVAAGDTDLYGPMLEAVCQDCGIPLYTGSKTPVTAHPAAAFLLCALEAVTEGMDLETVTAYLRTRYSGVTADECDRLENYAYTWSIRGARWQTAWTEHPEGYDAAFTEDTRQELEALNALRQRAVGPLLRLRQGLRTANNTRSQVECVYRFMEETELFSQIQSQVEQLTEQGCQAEAQETAQVWNILMECLQQMVSVLGQTAQNGRELLKILRLALEQYELATIPATLDAVAFGGVDAMRGKEPRLLYVLGANQGSIPAGPSGGSLLTEWERDVLLRQMEIQLAPSSEGSMERQLLQVYSAFTAPTEYLVVSYAAGASGEQLQPSFLVQRLETLFPEREGPRPSAAVTPEDLTEAYLTAEETGQTGLMAAIRHAARMAPELEDAIVSAKASALPREQQVTEELSRRLFGSTVTLTASRLDQLGNCPLSFFLNYGLKARPRKAAAFDAAEFGTFLHYILEKTVGELENKALPLRDDESRDLVDRYMEPYLETRMQDAGGLTPRQRYLYTRNGQEAQALLTEVSQELAVSEFRPCAFELRFGQGGDMVEVRGKSGTGRLDGMVDRADLWRGPAGDYLRIIDYKSGSKKFDYTDLYGGVGMQMLLYLFALERTGIPGVTARPIPAGVLYFPAKRAITSVEEPPQPGEPVKQRSTKRSGLVLADEAVLAAMEADAGSAYLPVAKRKSGLGDYAVTPQQLRVLEEFINRRMAQAVDRIFSGDFRPDPFYRGQTHDPCQWCDYGDVCQKDQRFRREHYHPTLSAKAFWELIGGGGDE